ncbi:hypothetical protein C8J57DRAFT_1220065 [Mycena rebaudengoi]|nr:hypothetical protein C8J57DRAFT_1220065 [Mycena rebaudengoi]
MVGGQIWVKRVRCVGSDVLEHVVPRGRQPRYGQGSSHVPVVKLGATLGVMESKSRRPGRMWEPHNGTGRPVYAGPATACLHIYGILKASSHSKAMPITAVLVPLTQWGPCVVTWRCSTGSNAQEAAAQEEQELSSKPVSAVPEAEPARLMYMRVMAELDAEDDTVDAGEIEIDNITGTRLAIQPGIHFLFGLLRP